MCQSHYLDGTRVPTPEETKYLGCYLNRQGNANLELKQRMANVFTVWNKLHAFWYKRNCSYAFKLQVYSAVIQAKLLYGLQSLQLTGTMQKSLDVFHKKASDEFCTCQQNINRANSDARLYALAGDLTNKPVRQLSAAYNSRKIKLMLK